MAEGKPHETQTGGLSGPIMTVVRTVIHPGTERHLQSDGAATATAGGTGKYNNYAKGRPDDVSSLPPTLLEDGTLIVPAEADVSVSQSRAGLATARPLKHPRP